MQNLKILRQQIDVLDKELLLIISKRLKIVGQIGILKRQLKLAALQPKRWQEVIDSRVKSAEKLKLDVNFTKKIFNLIHEEALKIENK